MKELIVIENKPALISVNFDELKQHLAAELEKYDVLVTAETVGDAKKLATELNATKKAIADARKAEVTKASEPVRAFEAKMKELTDMVEDGRQKILTQVQRFEDETREKARTLLEVEREKLWEKHGIETEFRRAGYADLVLLTSITGKGNLAAGARTKLESRIVADKQLQDQTRMRLLQLENESYRAGLAAPLSRDHVQPFLFADDAAYRSELDRILAAEIQRQEQAEQRMRQQIEREREQQVQQAAREADRLARQQAAEEEKPAPTPQPQPDPEPVPAAATAEPTQSGLSIPITVHIELRTSVRPDMPDHPIEKEVRRILEAAGITTLHSVRIERPAPQVSALEAADITTLHSGASSARRSKCPPSRAISRTGD